ncbi:helix-turn-helix domain-containing protein [Roseateles asaccharophilus]|uniref:Transcriptional regulator GlxA family with amidase domain n=1 Tax=Roseateles asaccharophilus TaxID=582607 RepID=A0ABU2AB04_9BURK|nr:helix-turn-helix domain-containing protein [Roseateles asaccharophilus]MDR7334376.1 transcriptional regulator GlxA family with amidase domain [Roseateles asaccharophilus]
MPRRRIGLLLYPGCMPAGLFAAADLLSAASLRAARPVFETVWVGLRAGDVACAQGMSLRAQAALTDARLDALLVPGYWSRSPDHLPRGLADNRELVQALGALPRRVALWSYCTGVALVAESGRLVGQPATAAWWMAPWLQQRHPRVDWQWQHAHVAGRSVATASGVHGHLPLVSAQVEPVIGPEAWQDVARLMMLPRPRQPAPVFDGLALTPATDPLLARLRTVAEATPAAEATLPRLAAALAVSPRTLARKAQALAGEPAGAFVRRVKLHQASEHLLHTGRSVGEVCAGLGFADEASFRRSFKALTGQTPQEFRQQHRP